MYFYTLNDLLIYPISIKGLKTCPFAFFHNFFLKSLQTVENSAMGQLLKKVQKCPFAFL